MTPFTLLDDQPYRGTDDPLGFDTIAETLAELILRSRSSTPLALGIESSWGTGKSTLMMRLADVLKRDPNVKTVHFNAWTAEPGGALEGLVKSVLDSLDGNILRRAARNEQLLSWVKIAGLVVADWLRLGSLVNALWREASIDAKARNELREVVLQSVQRWAGVSELGPERLLVVFVDDLDRCSPTNVLQVFEAIKLYLDAPGLVFVIGYDRDVVSDAILGAKHFEDDTISFRYLEKIVQLVYRLPTVSEESAARLLDIYLERSATRDLFDATCRSLTIEQNARNPRSIKRFINNFILEYGLDSDWERFGAETLVRVLIIDVYFPEFGQLLRTRSEEDPVQQFRTYRSVREALRRGEVDETHWPALIDRFRELGLPRLQDYDPTDALAVLEREIRPSFPKFAANDEFLGLIEGLQDVPELREKLRRYRPATVASAVREAYVYLSYARADASHAGRLVADLQAQLGESRVVAEGGLGSATDWRSAVEQVVGSAAVVLVVIGRSWLESLGPESYVEEEVALALARPDAFVVPVLVGQTSFPDPLPPRLQSLAMRQAATVSDDTWDQDVRQLLSSLEIWLAERGSVVSPREVQTYPRKYPRGTHPPPAL
jgi:hypothetical protein